MSDIQTYIESIPERRRDRFIHYMDVIQTAQPDYEPELWDSGSGIIGFGRYHYKYASGRTGESMQVGLANRVRYIALYASCAGDAETVVRKFKDRLPGCKLGKSCIEVPDSVVLDDATLTDLTRTVTESFRTAMRKPKEPGKIYIWE